MFFFFSREANTLPVRKSMQGPENDRGIRSLLNYWAKSAMQLFQTPDDLHVCRTQSTEHCLHIRQCTHFGIQPQTGHRSVMIAPIQLLGLLMLWLPGKKDNIKNSFSTMHGTWNNYGFNVVNSIYLMYIFDIRLELWHPDDPISFTRVCICGRQRHCQLQRKSEY